MKTLLRSPGYKAKIIQLILEQHDQGIDGNNEKLKSAKANFSNAYSDYTIFLKEQKGQPTDRVTLKDKGTFYASHNVLLDGEDFLITAQTLKEDNDLIEVWGEDILMLTDENLNKIIDITRDIAVRWLQEILLT